MARDGNARGVMAEVWRNAPCDGCVREQLCAEGLACRAFRYWVMTGARQNPLLKMRPTRAIYRAIFERDEAI